MKRDYDAKISELKENGYHFSIRSVLDKSFNLFKRSAGLYLAFIVLYIVVQMILSFIIPEVLNNLINSYLISPIIMAGYVYFSYKLSKDEEVKMSDFFTPIASFKDYGVAYLITRIIVILPFVVIGLIFLQRYGFLLDTLLTNDFSAIQLSIDEVDFEPSFILALLAGALAAFYFSIVYIFTIPFFLFNDRSKTILEDLEDLRKITSKKFFKFLAYGIALVLLNMLGALALIVGLLVTIPVSFISIFVLFDEIFGTGDTDANRDFEFEELK